MRILNAGTEAVTRVLIESEDENGERWTTVGVSPNIIDASFQALMDSVVYKLVKSGAPAQQADAVCVRSILVTIGFDDFEKKSLQPLRRPAAARRRRIGAAASCNFGRMSSTVFGRQEAAPIRPARMKASRPACARAARRAGPRSRRYSPSGSACCAGRAGPRSSCSTSSSSVPMPPGRATNASERSNIMLLALVHVAGDDHLLRPASKAFSLGLEEFRDDARHPAADRAMVGAATAPIRPTEPPP